MGVTVSLPGALASYAEGRRRVAIEPPFTTVGQALDQVFRLYPGLRDRVLTEEGVVRRHVNVFVGTDSIRDTGGLGTPVVDGVEIAIIPAVSGGAELLGDRTPAVRREDEKVGHVRKCRPVASDGRDPGRISRGRHGDGLMAGW